MRQFAVSHTGSRLKDIGQPVLFFDGECNLCNGTVQFIIRRDKKKLFLFAPLQSTYGQEARAYFGDRIPNSLILFYKGRFLIKSDAALTTFRLLGGLWSASNLLSIIPQALRDHVYDFISRNRYKWFGKQSACIVPTPELSARFL